jgi:hypothetical protein
MTTSLDSILSGAAANASAPATASTPAEKLAPQEQAARPEAASAAPAAEVKPQGEARPAGEAPANPEAPEPATVPIKALHDERGKVKRYTEQVASFEKEMGDLKRQNVTLGRQVQDLIAALRTPPAQPQQNAPQPQAPDFFADPEGAVRAMIAEHVQPLAAHQGRMTEQMSQQFAVQNHGAEAVQAAYAELENRIAVNPTAARGEYQRIMSSGNPWGELVKWHKNETALKEIGNDPVAYRERLKAELLEEMKGQPAPAAPNAQASPAAPAAPAPVLPTNLAAARNAGVRSGPAYGGPLALQDIFDRAQKKTRAA